jgi:hypothetical protein
MKLSRPSCSPPKASPPIGLSHVPFLRKSSASEVGTTFELRQNSAVVYSRGARRGADRTEAQQQAAIENLLTQQQAGSTKGKGYMSKATRSEVMKCVQRMISMASVSAAKTMRYNSKLGYRQQVCYLTFLTLVLPSDQVCKADGTPDDKHVKALVGRFMSEVQRVCGVVHYVAVFEPQPTTGNLHAHVLIDKFVENLPDGQNKVDATPLRLTKLWNHFLRGAGYIEPYAAKMRAKYASGLVFDSELAEVHKQWDGAAWCDVAVPVSEATQLSRYAYGVATDWQEPNTVDIHAVGKAENLAGYIAAYMAKNEGVRPIDGRLWSHSKGLEKLPLYQEDFNDEVRASVSQLIEQGKAKTLLVTGSGVFTTQEYEDNDLAALGVAVVATIYTWRQSDWWAVAPPGYVRRYRHYWRDVLRREYGV